MMRKEEEQGIEQVAILQDVQEEDVDDQQQMYSSLHQAWNKINVRCKRTVKTVNELATNIAFNVKHSKIPFIQRKQIKLEKGSEPVFLLGRKYDYQQNQEFLERFREIIWVTYRAELEGRVGDTGWGCMIRVCQMVLAEALKRCHPKLHTSQIINEVSESSRALFSFDKICTMGNLSEKWTSSTEILSVLKEMLAHQHKYKLFLDIYSGSVSIKDATESNLKYPLLICVSNRLGESNLPKEYTESLLSLLENPFFVGLIAGVGNEALYNVGYHGRNLIAFDPHYVQSQFNGEAMHFQLTPWGVPIQKIKPSLGLCFLLMNRQKHQQWVQDIAVNAHFHCPYNAIQFDKQASQQIYFSRYGKPDSDEQSFQIL